MLPYIFLFLFLQCLNIGNQLLYGGFFGGPAGAEPHNVVVVVHVTPEGNSVFVLQFCQLVIGQDWELLVGVGLIQEWNIFSGEGFLDLQRQLYGVVSNLQVAAFFK